MWGGPCSCQASYGWLVSLANELQVAKIAAIETFLDLASFFAREAVSVVFAFFLKPGLRLCDVAWSQLDLIDLLSPVLAIHSGLPDYSPPPTLDRLTDILHSLSRRLIARHGHLAKRHDGIRLFWLDDKAPGGGDRRRTAGSRLSVNRVALCLGRIAKTCRLLISSPPSWRRHQTNSPRLAL